MCSTPVIKSVCTHGNLERGQASDPDKVKRYDLEKVKVKWTPQRWVKQGVIYVVVKCCPSKGIRLGATCKNTLRIPRNVLISVSHLEKVLNIILLNDSVLCNI